MLIIKLTPRFWFGGFQYKNAGYYGFMGDLFIKRIQLFSFTRLPSFIFSLAALSN